MSISSADSTDVDIDLQRILLFWRFIAHGRTSKGCIPEPENRCQFLRRREQFVLIGDFFLVFQPVENALGCECARPEVLERIFFAPCSSSCAAALFALCCRCRHFENAELIKPIQTDNEPCTEVEA